MVKEEVDKEVGASVGTDFQIPLFQCPIHSQASSSLQSFLQVIVQQLVGDLVAFPVVSHAEDAFEGLLVA